MVTGSSSPIELSGISSNSAVGALNLSGADLANAQVNLAAGAASFTVGGVSHSQVELGGTAWTHGLDGLRDAWSRLRGPGHPTWKLGTAAAALAAVALLLVSVPDRVTASVVIEARCARSRSRRPKPIGWRCICLTATSPACTAASPAPCA